MGLSNSAELLERFSEGESAGGGWQRVELYQFQSLLCRNGV